MLTAGTGNLPRAVVLKLHCDETDTKITKIGGIVMKKTTMSVQELSAQMGISLPKAYELVKEPGFPTIRIGAKILIPIEAYKEWLVRSSLNNRRIKKKGGVSKMGDMTVEELKKKSCGSYGQPSLQRMEK